MCQYQYILFNNDNKTITKDQVDYFINKGCGLQVDYYNYIHINYQLLYYLLINTT